MAFWWCHSLFKANIQHYFHEAEISFGFLLTQTILASSSNWWYWCPVHVQACTVGTHPFSSALHQKGVSCYSLEKSRTEHTGAPCTCTEHRAFTLGTGMLWAGADAGLHGSTMAVCRQGGFWVPSLAYLPYVSHHFAKGFWSLVMSHSHRYHPIKILLVLCWVIIAFN